jgi:hypothetical protein
MKETQKEKLRSDKPSGRQAAEQPEHSEKHPDASSLHQGQGPDFPTQDPHIQGENPGLGVIPRRPTERRQSRSNAQNAPETIGKAVEKNNE